MEIEAIRNHVIFQFVEEIQNDRFRNSTHWGLIVTSGDTNQSNIARWGRVTHLGPDVISDIKVKDFILIEEGKWTPHFVLGGNRYWKTDDQVIIAVSDEPYTTY